MCKSKKLDSITREGEREGGGCINISKDNTFLFLDWSLFIIEYIIHEIGLGSK